MPQTWESIITPFLQGRGGSVQTSIDDELNWIDDPFALDPFEDVFDTEARSSLSAEDQAAARQTFSLDAPGVLDFEPGGLQRTPDAISGMQKPPRFKLPAALTKGERTADFIAASKGVDVRAPKGTGKLLDIARTQLGVDYLFGSFDPGDSFDCSGFTKWVYSRSMGIALPHSAREQAAASNRVERDDLQPGDLVFYVYGRLGNDVDHVGIYMGGGKQIAASSSADKVTIQDVDWDNFVYGGRFGDAPADAAKGAGSGAERSTTKPVRTVKRVPVPQEQALAPMMLLDGAPAFSSVMDSLFAPDRVPIVTEKNVTPNGATRGSVWQQLRRGFIDAGRPDLARMATTKDFQTWLRAENGALNPALTSQYFEGHGVNYGLFQFWEGHDWTQKYVQGNRFTASPYEQAKLVAQHFSHLTPERIREYARQVRAGDYHGWG